MARREVFDPSWTGTNCDTGPTGQCSRKSGGTAAAHPEVYILDVGRAEPAPIASCSARDCQPALRCGTRCATAERNYKNQRKIPTAYQRPELSQGKEINKQDGACIARGPVPVSALRFLPGKVVASGEGKRNAQ